MIYCLLSLTFSFFGSLLSYFALVVLITVANRAYKINYARRNKKPVDGSQAVLVTGATSGIGLAVSKHLYKLGYSLLVGYYSSTEPGYDELMQMSIQSHKKQHMIFIELDVRNQQSIKEAFERCTKELARNDMKLYALINNAGLGSLQPFAWLQKANIRNIIETNLVGSLMMTREFLPLLVESKGRILNVSSGLGLVPGANYTTYGITKSALIYFTRSMNQESVELNYGIKSVAVIPHNYIKNTNICSHNVETNESAWSELRPIEQRLYKAGYDRHLKLAVALEEATKLHMKLADKQQSRASERSGSDGLGGRRQNRTGSGSINERDTGHRLPILKQALDVVGRLRGENVALTLEQSGVLECFEDGLRLEDPPEHIFAGDNIYNLLIGSLLLSMPASCLNLLARSVAPSLYR